MHTQRFRRAPPPTAEPFDVVQVFYGTDRAAIEPADGGWLTYVCGFCRGFCVLVTLCPALVAASKRSTALWVVSAVGVLVASGSATRPRRNSSLPFAGKASKARDTRSIARRKAQVQLGVCEVTIPKTHDPGELEAPSILRLEVREDADKHVVLSKTERLARRAVLSSCSASACTLAAQGAVRLRSRLQHAFEDAARRTAQIHYDLKFEGAPVFFSWPANDKLILTYPADENNVAWSAPHLKQFLLEIVKQSEAQSINLIAHSMGNRALAAALREIELELRGESRLFNQVVLAAPDIDADEFRTNIAPAMQRTAKH